MTMDMSRFANTPQPPFLRGDLYLATHSDDAAGYGEAACNWSRWPAHE